MTTGRYSRRNASFRPTGIRQSDRENNFFLGMVGFSLVIHLIVAAIFSHNPTDTKKRRPPALYVDLVMAPPVINPQRGSASAITKTAPVAPAAAPPQPVIPTKTAQEQVALKGKEVKKPAATKEDDGIAEALAKMKQRKAEQDEEKEALNAIAAMRKRTTPAPQVATTVGSASGTGDEAGSAISEWLQSAVKAKWVWPDRKRKDLSAEIEVNFASNGKIIGYRFKRSSGDARFDKSLTDAFIKLETLPMPLGKPLQETFLFNLEDLQGQ